MANSKLLDLLHKANKNAERNAQVTGKLGYINESGARIYDVAARPGWIWVTLDTGTPIEAQNNGVGSLPNKPLNVVLELMPNGYRVKDIDLTKTQDNYGNSAPPIGSGPHSHAIGSGYEFQLDELEFKPGLVWYNSNSSGMTLTINPIAYKYNGVETYFSGTILNLISPDIRPSTSGYLWARICLDMTTNSIVTVTGSTYPIIVPSNPTQPWSITISDFYLSLCGIKIRNGQTQISDISDFIDMRLWIGANSASGGIPAPANAKYLVQQSNSSLPNAQDMSALATGIVKNTTITGVQSIANYSDIPTPLTTKGDIFVYGSSNTSLPLGTDGYVLTADSTQTTGLKWSTIVGGINQLTGDGTAGPGTGSQVFTLATVNSTTGTFSRVKSITTNAKGLITAITQGLVDLASEITGILGLANGGTNADLSSSGSATAFLAQNASHVISARSILDSDLPSTLDNHTLTNTTFGNTNTVTLKDNKFTLQDDGDTTKQAVFQLSGITTATTRTFTFPDQSSTLVGIDISQNITNKSLDNTNIITLKDSLFTLQNVSDTTKQAQFLLSGITTATTRTYTLPNGNTTIVGTDTTQTLTNKSISGSQINSGSVSIANGGTGQTSQTTGFNALSPLTTKGDIIVFDGTNNVRQSIGTDTYVLTADSSQTNGLKWSVSSGGSPITAYQRSWLGF